MSAEDKKTWLAAGILSAALSFLFSGIAIAGAPLIAPFALLVPAMPILATAFINDRRNAVYAAGVAILAISIILPPATAIMVCIFAILPATLLVWWLESPTTSLPAIAEKLTYLLAAGLSLLALSLWNQDYSGSFGLEGLMRSQMAEEIVKLSPQDIAPEAIEKLNSFMEVTFFIPAACGWIWVFILVFYMVMAKKIALKIGGKLKPVNAGYSYSSTNLLGLIAISGIAVAIGSNQAAYLGKILFIIFLLPYFIIGMVRLHFGSAAWQGRGFLLFAIYFIMALALWPMLLVSISEVARQCIRLAQPLKEKD